MAEESTSCNAGGFHAQMSFHSGNVPEQWRMFKRQLQFYCDSKFAVTQQTDRKRIGVLMTALGREGIDIYDTFYKPNEQPTFDAILAKFDTYCKPRKNTVFERSVYFRLQQKPKQTFDSFLLDLRRQATLCEFAEAERDKLLRDMLVIGIRDAKLREELLRDPDLSLETATTACKAREQAQTEATLIDASFAPDPITVADVKRAPLPLPTQTQPTCPACSYRHGTLRPCPALKGSCNKCGAVGHFSRMCRAKAVAKPVRAIETAPEVEPADSASVDTREFEYLKKLIVAEPVLAFFDPNCPVVVQTDSSKDGLGSVLLQNDRPIAFASRALTPAEVKYSQIEKEMLAIVFALERFHEFVYGRSVLVQSDHRPLEAIVLKDLDKVSARLQRLRLRLLKYSLHVKYTPGKALLVADALSRAFLSDEAPCLDYQSVIVHTVKTLAVSPQKVQLIAAATSQDPVLATVRTWVTNNAWPADKSQLAPGLAKFHGLAALISVADEMLFYENRLIVPASLREEFLQKLHEGHLGCEKTKRLARETVFWHGLTVDIANWVAKCSTCQKFARNNAKEQLQSYPVPQYPWQQLAIDIATFQSTDFLVVVDKYSNWPEVMRLTTKTAQEVITHLQNLFAKQGIPETVVSDNNPFNSAAYLQFAKDWGFTPIFTSPHFSQSNGHAERTVQTVKMLLRKCADEKSSFQYALLQYRNTPVADTNCSPAQALMGRRLRTKLPVASALLQPQLVPPADVIARKEKSQQVQEFYYNRDAEELPPLTPNQPVWVKDTLADAEWQPATVAHQGPNPRSFVVEKEDGGTVVRNRRFLRPRAQIVKPVRFRD